MWSQIGRMKNHCSEMWQYTRAEMLRFHQSKLLKCRPANLGPYRIFAIDQSNPSLDPLVRCGVPISVVDAGYVSGCFASRSILSWWRSCSCLTEAYLNTQWLRAGRTMDVLDSERGKDSAVEVDPYLHRAGLGNSDMPID